MRINRQRVIHLLPARKRQRGYRESQKKDELGRTRLKGKIDPICPKRKARTDSKTRTGLGIHAFIMTPRSDVEDGKSTRIAPNSGRGIAPPRGIITGISEKATERESGATSCHARPIRRATGSTLTKFRGRSLALTIRNPSCRSFSLKLRKDGARYVQFVVGASRKSFCVRVHGCLGARKNYPGEQENVGCPLVSTIDGAQRCALRAPADDYTVGRHNPSVCTH